MESTIDIIIVNWNSGPLLRECLESIAAAEKEPFALDRVIVVDNASRDGSAERLEGLKLPLTVIRNAENRGFGAACNQGASDSRADYLLFLNPDIRLFKDSLKKPLAFLQAPENVGIGICGIQLVDAASRISRSCARFPTPTRFFSQIFGLDRMFPHLFPNHFMIEWDHRESREDVDQVMGAFFLVRRPLFIVLGGFDERFFVYFEDLDFAYRMRKAGWRSFYLAEAKAYHKGGGTTEQVRSRRLLYHRSSRILYGFKHFDRTTACILMLLTLFVEPLTRLIWATARRSPGLMAETIRGFTLLWGAVPKLLRWTRTPRAEHGVSSH
jgi:GT2 family glycosyltransferase